MRDSDVTLKHIRGSDSGSMHSSSFERDARLPVPTNDSPGGEDFLGVAESLEQPPRAPAIVRAVRRATSLLLGDDGIVFTSCSHSIQLLSIGTSMACVSIIVVKFRSVF